MGKRVFGLFALAFVFFSSSSSHRPSIWKEKKLSPRKSRHRGTSTAGCQSSQRLFRWPERRGEHRSSRRRRQRACSGRAGRQGTSPSSNLEATAPTPTHPSPASSLPVESPDGVFQSANRRLLCEVLRSRARSRLRNAEQVAPRKGSLI